MSTNENIRTFVIIDDNVYPTDSGEQIDIAKMALLEAGMTSADVWAGDPDDESYKNGQILFA